MLHLCATQFYRLFISRLQVMLDSGEIISDEEGDPEQA